MNPIDQTVEYPVHCCVCLNTTGGKTPAKWLLPSGHLVCEAHTESSIDELKAAVNRRAKST